MSVLASVLVVGDGTWSFYKGVRTEEDYFYSEKEISEVRSLADKAKNMGNRRPMTGLIGRRGGSSRS